MRVLITGGCGFIGHHVVARVLRDSVVKQVVVLDALTYAGRRESLPRDARVIFVKGRVEDYAACNAALDAFDGPCDLALHLAAETHVDRSIKSAPIFLVTNILGTQYLLDVLRARRVRRLLHVSTDEVYGDRDELPEADEFTQFAPSSPYSASKCAAEYLLWACARTHGIPPEIVVVRPTNCYGEGQYAEKFIPTVIAALRAGAIIPVYGDGRQIREWLDVSDAAEGIWVAACRGETGTAYNLGSGPQSRMTNLEVVMTLACALNVLPRIEHVADRPGHDRRYAVSSIRASQSLGWSAQIVASAGISNLVK